VCFLPHGERKRRREQVEEGKSPNLKKKSPSNQGGVKLTSANNSTPKAEGVHTRLSHSINNITKLQCLAYDIDYQKASALQSCGIKVKFN